MKLPRNVSGATLQASLRRLGYDTVRQRGSHAARALKPYPDYKDSGVQWLGKVPAHWEVRRLKSWLDVNEFVLSEDTDPEYTFKYLDIGSVATGRLTAKPKRIRFGNSPSRARRVVRSGDTIVSTVRTYLKAVWHAEHPGDDLVASTGFAVLTPRRGTFPRFVSYFCRSDPFTNSVTAEAVGIAYPAIAETRLGTFEVCIPPYPEQAAIARFLDHADRRIRRYIRAKQELIALLEEQKQAIIHEAVTGKIDVRTGRPYVAYKPSAVEWLGDVPEHWRCSRLKAILSRPIQNGLFKKKDEFGTGVPLVNVADVYGDRFQIESSSLGRVRASVSEVRRFQVQKGDIFFVRSSLKLEGTGRSAIARDCTPDTVFECHLVQANPDARRINGRYLVVQLNSHGLRHYLISRANMVTMATVAQGTISSCPIVIPSRSEQDGTIEWIDSEWSRIARAMKHTSGQVALLREFRARLIADVVTGKLDVREAAAALPEVHPLAAEEEPDDGSNPEVGSDGDELSVAGQEAEA